MHNPRKPYRRCLILVFALSIGVGSVGNAQAYDTYTADDLVQRTLVRHPLIAASQHTIDQFEARLIEARSARIPRIKLKSVFAAIPGQKGNALNGNTDFSPEAWGPFSSTELSAALPLYTFGKIAQYKKLAASGVDIAESQHVLAKAEARQQVLKAIATLYAAQEALEVVEDGKKYLDRARKKLEELEEEDSDDYDPTDLLRLRLVEVDTQENLSNVRELERSAKSAIRALAGLEADDPVQLAPKGNWSAVPTDLTEKTCIEKALSDRPEMRALKSGLEARKAAVDLAETQFWPDLLLGGYVRYNVAPGADNQASPFAYDPYNIFTGGLGIILNWNLDIPSKMSSLRVARASHGRLEAQGRAYTGALMEEVKMAFARHRMMQEQKRLAKRGKKAARGWLTAKFNLYDAGLASYDDLTKALTAYFTRELKLLWANYRADLAYIALEQAVGSQFSTQ